MYVKFIQSKATGEYPDLTNGKTYEAESETFEMEYAGGEVSILCYMLLEDDSDEQVPYDVRIFEVVQESPLS